MPFTYVWRRTTEDRDDGGYFLLYFYSNMPAVRYVFAEWNGISFEHGQNSWD